MEAGGAWLSSGGFKLSLSILESDHVAEMRAEKKRKEGREEEGRKKELSQGSQPEKTNTIQLPSRY